jgi:type I restriction enzyme, S subunit
MRVRAAHPHLNAEELGNVRIALPPLDDQNIISDFLDEKLAQVDLRVDDMRNAIALLHERRSALISAAVTGKIDVRGLAPAVQEAA